MKLNWLWLVALVLTIGCIPSQSKTSRIAPFEDKQLDSALAILIDTSGSFSGYWDSRAYDLFLDLCDQYFSEAIGMRSKLVIGQIGSKDQVVVFEGQPSDLRQRFPDPASLSEFLKANTNGGSNVYAGTRGIVRYMNNLDGVTQETRLLTVVLSDMLDTEGDATKRSQVGYAMIAELSSFASKGGALALYYVADSEMGRWRDIVDRAGFADNHYIIENYLSERPELPMFE
ncbi:MAG: hypothetical protein R3C53_19190 [Pirellulaceae bacterium]